VGRVSSTPPASSTIQRPSRPLHCSQVTTAARPELTITEAAKATGVDRRTISRRLDADAFPNAHRAIVAGLSTTAAPPLVGPWWLTGAGSLLPMAIADPYRELARAQLIERIENGNALDWFNMTTYAELGDRTPTDAWQAGDHQVVELLIDKWYADSEASAERHRNDPKFMAMIDRRREAMDAARSIADKQRRSA
jgi:hypothetical protein